MKHVLLFCTAFWVAAFAAFVPLSYDQWTALAVIALVWIVVLIMVELHVWRHGPK